MDAKEFKNYVTKLGKSGDEYAQYVYDCNMCDAPNIISRINEYISKVGNSDSAITDFIHLLACEIKEDMCEEEPYWTGYKSVDPIFNTNSRN